MRLKHSALFIKLYYLINFITSRLYILLNSKDTTRYTQKVRN